MNDFELRIYLEEARAQCLYALAAADAIRNNLEVIHDSSKHGYWDKLNFAQRELFRSVHSLLTHTSNVSKIFWPIKSKGREWQARKARGELLRERVPVIVNLETLKDREVRNHLEHFDERLDEWRNRGVGFYAQDNIGPIAALGVDEKCVMRHYDNETNCFVFRGHSFDIQAVINDFETLYSELCSVLD